MFAALEALPPDALLGITRMFKDDARATKVDLGVGVFKTPENVTPVLRAVRTAQARIVERETTKVYLPADGAPGFGEAVRRLMFAEAPGARIAMLQTPGGCGALRVGAELLARAGAERILAGDPTWANHKPLLGAAGLKFESAPFYDPLSGGVRFGAFFEAASRLGARDVLLVHGCCHNPTGADLSRDEIDSIIDLAARRGFILFIDLAYQGFGESLEHDAYFARAALDRVPEALVAYSCSKNFGLYRERTGALAMIGADADRAAAMKTHALNIARQIYSMPPGHGGLIAAEILGDAALASDWRSELEDMRRAVLASRRMLADALQARQLGDRFEQIARQRGMFSMLPLSPAQVKIAREAHGVYMAGDGRINLCGVNAGNVGYIADSIAAIIRA